MRFICLFATFMPARYVSRV